MNLKFKVATLIILSVLAIGVPVYGAWYLSGKSTPFIYKKSDGSYRIYFKGYSSASTSTDFISVKVTIYDPSGYFYDQIYATDIDSYIEKRTGENYWTSGEKYKGYGEHVAKIYHLLWADEVQRTISAF